MLLKNNKWLFFCMFFTCVMAVCILTAFTNKKTALEQTQLFCLENIKEMQTQLDSFQKLGEQHADKKILIERFKKIRVAYKRFEFLLEYFDARHFPFFNGVNAVELDEGYINPNAKPEGLQVIEAELFNDSLDFDRIVYLTKQLKYRTLSFYLILKDAQLRDSYIFEAIRFHLIRIETLSLVSFDSPDIRNNVEEISASLNVFKKIILFYKDDKNAMLINTTTLYIQQAINYLSTKDFNNLDRLFFIKNYLQPITKNIIKLQQQLKIPYLEEIGQLFRAVNIQSNNIYNTDFLNSKFYAQDRYYNENPLYTVLGKKLFYDKRLSADGTMSCATCHQPNNFFSDKLSTAITNKLGEFQKRNTPSLLNVSLQAAYFYDLSAITLEAQIDRVVNNPIEFNHSYDSIFIKIKLDTTYVRLFSQAFPEYKDQAISSYTINTCISDFERKLIFLNSTFDKYMRGQTSTIDASVKRGFNLFMGKAQCGSCHFAPTFFGTTPPFYGTSDAEVLGITKTFDTIKPVLDDDIGRFKNFEVDALKFAIKTSTVRNAQLTEPYMHNGGFKSLDEVVEFYNHGGGAGLGLNIPNQTLPADRLNLTKQDKNDLISFIKSLTDTSGLQKFKL